MPPATLKTPLSSLLVAALVSLAASATAAPAETPAPPSPAAVLRAFVESGRVPGVVALAATRDGVIADVALGFRNISSREPMQLDTLFSIASMTKPVTSVAVMQLVEQGKVALDASIAQYLPELAHPKVLEGFDDAGQPRLRDATRPPTIRELLANTAGYAYSIWNERLQRFEAAAKLPGGRDRFPLLPLASDPGTRWEYSPATGILGWVVETVSGLTLEEYFRRNIFAPLGMSDTFFQIPPEKWGRVTRTYRHRADGTFESGPEPSPAPPNVTYFAGDGGLSSTGPDYLRFVRALLKGGELDGARILRTETVDLMGQNQIGVFEAGVLRSVRPPLSNDVDLFPGVKDKFGLGFLLNAEPVPGGRAAGSLMWAGLFNTYFWIDRQNGVGGVVLTQVLPFADTAVLGMLGAFEKAVYAGRP